MQKNRSGGNRSCEFHLNAHTTNEQAKKEADFITLVECVLYEVSVFFETVIEKSLSFLFYVFKIFFDCAKRKWGLLLLLKR